MMLPAARIAASSWMHAFASGKLAESVIGSLMGGKATEENMAGRILRVGVVSLLAAAGAPALAQSQQDLLKCARIVSVNDRVACYDKVVAQLSAEAKKIVAEREVAAEKLAAEEAAARKAQAEAESRARFGAEGLGTAPDGTRIEEISATIVEGFEDRQGQVVFLLDNGQVWRQTDGPYRGPVRPGAAVTVKRGTLGNYMLLFAGQSRSVPVRRIR
jgi:hypothetical protein